MARGHDPGDRRPAREERRDGEEESVSEREDEAEHPQGELRWVQLDAPRSVVEIGRNGRILESHFHERYDSWEVLLETYEGELSE